MEYLESSVLISSGEFPYIRFGILARACYNFDCRDELKKIQCPVLVLGSAQDRVLGGASSPDFAERLGCELPYVFHNFEDEQELA